MGNHNRWFEVKDIAITDTLRSYGFTQEKLNLLTNNAYWSKPYDWIQKGLKEPYWVAVHRFIDGLPLLPPLTEKQVQWIKNIVESLHCCAYQCDYHKGKVEWHHPIKERPDIGLYLCEAHHSILMGRKTKYTGELNLGKSLEQMRAELKELERQAIIQAMDRLINKH